MTAEHTHHAIDPPEFTGTDLPASRAFYAEAFGWEFTEYGPGYVGIRRPDGGEAGGISAGETAQPPLVILYSDDLDATVAAVRRGGGTIVAEPYDFPGGRRFEFTDPDGTRLAVWSE